jgi:hypothetical protein
MPTLTAPVVLRDAQAQLQKVRSEAEASRLRALVAELQSARSRSAPVAAEEALEVLQR